MKPITVPNLSAADHAFLLDTGETAVVRVEPQPFAAGQEQVTVHLTARLADPATGDTVRVGGHECHCPSHSFAVLASALADGRHDLSVLLADAIAAQAERARRTSAALASLAQITGGAR